MLRAYSPSVLLRRLYSSVPKSDAGAEQTAKDLYSKLAQLESSSVGTSSKTELEKQDQVLREQLKLVKSQVAMKHPRPISPSLRWYRWPIYPYLFKGKPFKKLTVTKKPHSGRNSSGRVTVRHKGGGYQRRIRIIDFFRNDSAPKTVVRIEYDPNRSAHLALLKEIRSKHTETSVKPDHESADSKPESLEQDADQKDGLFSYIVAPMGMRAGDEVRSFRAGIPDEYLQKMEGNDDPGVLADLTLRRGNCIPLKLVPLGTVIHNVGKTASGPAVFCRSAGTYARLYEKIPERQRALIKLSSGETRYVSLDACATIGIVSNPDHQHRSLGKAGRSRNLGIRPTVRGTAMNKVDHPHGGGRGKSKGNKIPVSPWGKLTKAGHKTRVGKNVNRELVSGRPRGRQGAI